jgi:hypothetical protein
VRAIETLEHAERAADLHFLDEKRSLGFSWPIRRQALDQVAGEPLKVQAHVVQEAESQQHGARDRALTCDPRIPVPSMRTP